MVTEVAAIVAEMTSAFYDVPVVEEGYKKWGGWSTQLLE